MITKTLGRHGGPKPFVIMVGASGEAPGIGVCGVDEERGRSGVRPERDTPDPPKFLAWRATLGWWIPNATGP